MSLEDSPQRLNAACDRSPGVAALGDRGYPEVAAEFFGARPRGAGVASDEASHSMTIA